jgi:hypothetical protein
MLMAMRTRLHLVAWSLLLAALPCPARSQLTAPLSVRLPSIDSTPPSRIRSLGDISTCHAWTCDQALSLALEMAPVASWRVGTEITGSRSVLPGGEGRVSDRRVDLVYGPARRSVWVGYGRSIEDLAGSSTQLSRLEYGATARWRSLSVDATMGTGSAPALAGLGSRIETSVHTTLDSLTGAIRTDTVRRTLTDSAMPGRTRWSSSALRVAWTADRWSVGAVIGRLVVTGERRPVWGSLDGSRTLGRRFTVLAKAGTVVGPFMSTRDGPRFAVSAGLFAHTSWLSTAPVERPAEHGMPAFDVSGLGGERYRLTVRMHGATHVEIASDVTAWQPVAMRRLRDDVWVVELALAAGIHQLSVRADGGRWAAPAGLTPVDDDFGGSSGAFVVR